MSTPQDRDKPGGNSSFGNTRRPPDIQGDEPDKQAEPHDPAHPRDAEPGKPGARRPEGPPR